MNAVRQVGTNGIWLGIILLTLSCAANPGPTINGPVFSFRLEWLGTADLDLHVRSPLGTEIWYADRRSASGGVLHVDCNVNPEQACAEPVETITWPPGEAPTGTYQYWVRLMHPRGTALPVAFQVYVLHGTDVIGQQQGEIGKPGDISDKWEVTNFRPK